MSSTLKLAATPDSVTSARQHVVDMLRGWKVCPEDIMETIRLVVSELVTNAVRHPDVEAGRRLPCSESESVDVELVLEVSATMVRVSVWDRDPAPPVLKDGGVEATGGRGIFLVAQMSARWGHYFCRPGPGKVVWAEIPIPTTDDAEASRRCADTGEPEAEPPPAHPDRDSPTATRTGQVPVGLKGR